jgi:predicted ATPase/DNA-binding winged helix-turn-helix (wHTH) protein
MAEQSPPARPVLLFGRFALALHDRTLTRDGVPIELGGRTLDTLIALATHPNRIMTKRELMALVWPDVTVDEGSLRFHIAVLRKLLGDGPGAGTDGGKAEGRFITTLAGRGYCFVAPVSLSQTPGSGDDRTARRAAYLPARLTHLIGRDDSIAAITEALTASRFVTIVGPGGVGKTAVAVTIAHDLMPVFEGAVLFVDLSQQSDPAMVPAAMASMLDLSVQSDDPVPSLIAMLREQRMLVVLDNCEHVIDGAARMAARLLPAAPHLVILATSREALRADGERVHRLAPLETPPAGAALAVQTLLGFPATRLFVDRAKAGGARLVLDDGSAAIVAEICRKLDGMALAIELVAARVDAWGLQQTAALLDDRFTLSWQGKRTAPERQQTLQATFDWSYRLLTETERMVFRGLALFVGPFTIEAALVVVTGASVDAATVFAAIDSLVAKSMVTAIPAGAMMRYRLLDTARACALDTITSGAERTALAARHAAYCLGWLDQFAANAPPLLDAARRASNLADLNNVRAACHGALARKAMSKPASPLRSPPRRSFSRCRC